MIRAPGIAPGRRLEGAAQLEDLGPTLLSLLGISAPAGIDGMDLAPWLRGERERSPRDAVLGRRKRYRGQPDQYFVRRWPEKWIGSPGGDGQRFGLAADPAETRARPAPTVPDALARSLTDEVRPGAPRRLDAETRRALEALGYLEPEGGDST